MSDHFEYRLAGESDIARSCDLLSTAGWGQVDPGTWRRWYVDGAGGPAMVGVAVDPADGAIVAQIELRPASVLVGTRRLTAGRLGSVVLHPRVRRLYADPMEHPAVGLWLMLEPAAKSVGVRLIYALPHRALLRLLGLPGSPFAVATFPCLVRPVREPPRESGGPVEVVDASTVDIDYLWRRTLAWTGAGASVCRTEPDVQSKLGTHLVLGLRGTGTPIEAYTVVRKRDGLILDSLAVSSDAMERVLSATIGYLAPLSERSEWPAGRVSALACKPVDDLLRSSGFAPVSHRFGFAVARLDDSVDDAVMDLGSWYLTGGD